MSAHLAVRLSVLSLMLDSEHFTSSELSNYIKCLYFPSCIPLKMMDVSDHVVLTMEVRIAISMKPRQHIHIFHSFFSLRKSFDSIFRANRVFVRPLRHSAEMTRATL